MAVADLDCPMQVATLQCAVSIKARSKGEYLQQIDWIRGDSLGLDIPAHAAALRQGGPAFLTRAFHAAGSLPADNRVSHISECREIQGGSTGRKLLLSVEYEHPDPSLETQLFVKFSRDFDNDIRDRAKSQMELEVLFALLSRSPDFPIAVPACYFTDFHHASGTGILVTQRVAFGQRGIEPLYEKCLDYKMPQPLAHYRALIRALGRLAGTHKAGRLPAIVEQYFPFAPEKLVVSQRAPYSAEQISERVQAYAGFVGDYPGLMPAHLCTESFLNRLQVEAPRFQQLVAVGQNLLQSDPDMIALCHWNAHVDNAWFWTGENGELQCGLMDWGNVSQMNVAMALWGCLSAAELSVWNDHLEELLALFATEFANSGGVALDLDTLKLHLTIYVATMGLAWMLDAPQYLVSLVPDLKQVNDRFDPRIENNERARSQWLIMSVFLNLWQQQDMVKVIEYLEANA